MGITAAVGEEAAVWECKTTVWEYLATNSQKRDMMVAHIHLGDQSMSDEVIKLENISKKFDKETRTSWVSILDGSMRASMNRSGS